MKEKMPSPLKIRNARAYPILLLQEKVYKMYTLFALPLRWLYFCSNKTATAMIHKKIRPLPLTPSPTGEGDKIPLLAAFLDEYQKKTQEVEETCSPFLVGDGVGEEAFKL